MILPLFNLLNGGPDSAVPILTIENTQFRFAGFVINVNYLTWLDVGPVLSVNTNLVVSIFRWTHVVGAIVESPHNIDVTLWQQQLYEPKAKRFYYSVEDAPYAYKRSPRYRRFYSAHNVWNGLLHDVIVDSLSPLCDLSPAIDTGYFAVEGLDWDVLNVNNSFSQLAENRLLVRLC